MMNCKRQAALAVLILGGWLPDGSVKASDKKAVTIRVLGDAVSATAALEKAAQGFTRETGVNVLIDKYGYEAALEKAVQDLHSKTGAYDIVLQSADALGKFTAEHAILGVDELERVTGRRSDFDADLFPKAWEALSWRNGVKYGYPVAANTMFVWYRKDLIENSAERQVFANRYGYALAPPQNWKQYRDLAEFFTRPEEGFYGTIVQGKRHPAIWFEWLNFAFSFGGGVMEKQHGWEYGPIIINSPETVKATEYYKSLKKFSPPGVTTFTWDDAIGQMRQGHIFKCIMWSDALFGVEDTKLSAVAGKVGFVSLPAAEQRAPVAQIAGTSYFVSRYSKHPKEAFQFELWMLNRDKQLMQELAGGASPRKSVYDDPRVRELPYAFANRESLAVAKEMIDTVAEAPQISDIIETAISDVLGDQKEPRQALDWAALQLHKLLGPKSPLQYPPAHQDGHPD